MLFAMLAAPWTPLLSFSRVEQISHASQVSICFTSTLKPCRASSFQVCPCFCQTIKTPMLTAVTLADAPVFGAAQPIYTAAPVFAHGIRDHLPQRIIKRSGETLVTVPPPQDLMPPSRPEAAIRPVLRKGSARADQYVRASDESEQTHNRRGTEEDRILDFGLSQADTTPLPAGIANAWRKAPPRAG
jgi:hypothetical protein